MEIYVSCNYVNYVTLENYVTLVQIYIFNEWNGARVENHFTR